MRRTARIVKISNMSLRRAIILGIVVALVHALGVGATAWYVAVSTEGQAALVWVYWMLADLPISLLYALFDGNFLIVHGLLGSIWWCFLVYLLIRGTAALRLKFAGPRSTENRTQRGQKNPNGQ